MPNVSAGGGARPIVSCVVSFASIDVHAIGAHSLLIDGLFDNEYDFNALTAIPSGLGLTFTFDGSSADIATTAAGVWALIPRINFFGGVDATLAGIAVESLSGASMPFGPPTGTHSLAFGGVWAFPSGASGVVRVGTEAASTAGTYAVAGNASLVRLG